MVDFAKAEEAERFARALAEQCAFYLRATYMPRLRAAVSALPAADLWWRPHAQTTSVGNLLLHLRGNVRQWIVSGLGGAPDARVREREFSAREGACAAELLDALQVTVDEACAVIESLPAGRWLAPVTIQEFDTTVLGAVLHIVEHFSWHTGQITWIAKARAGAAHGVAFYDDGALNAARND